MPAGGQLESDPTSQGLGLWDPIPAGLGLWGTRLVPKSIQTHSSTRRDTVYVDRNLIPNAGLVRRPHAKSKDCEVSLTQRPGETLRPAEGFQESCGGWVSGGRCAASPVPEATLFNSLDVKGPTGQQWSPRLVFAGRFLKNEFSELVPSRRITGNIYCQW